MEGLFIYIYMHFKLFSIIGITSLIIIAIIISIIKTYLDVTKIKRKDK
jgi:hypothetical protein